jgi:hypothetical protein
VVGGKDSKNTVMRDASGGTSPTVVAKDFSDQTNQYIIIEGCKYNAPQKTRVVDLEFGNMINPYIVKTTDPLKVEIYKGYTVNTGGAGVLSQEIQSITALGDTLYEFTIPSSNFTTKTLAGL